MSDSTRTGTGNTIQGDPNWRSHLAPASKVYLVTGGTGTLGTAVTKALLAAGHRVRAYARNEHRHEDLERQIPEDQRPRLSCLIGAVEDGPRLKRAMRGVDYVIHAAAMKVVPLCEYNPAEAIRTNVEGTANVIEAVLDSGCSKAVFVSTDKGRAPSTLYGATKLCAERLWLAANRYLGGARQHVFSAVAYGNVFASRGSLIHAFQEQGPCLRVTDPSATRFHITLPQAVRFVLDAVEHAEPGTLWIPKLPSYRVGDFATAFSRVYGITQEPVITGLRAAEKRHEDLISENESYACSVTPEKHYEINPWYGEIQHYVLEPGKVHCQGGWSYNSGSNPWKLSIGELEKEIRLWAER